MIGERNSTHINLTYKILSAYTFLRVIRLEEATHDTHATTSAGASQRNLLKFVSDNSLLVFLLAVVIIVLVTVYFRIPMLSFYGFYEPDGYFHYSIIRLAVNNGFSIPQIDPLSGWPPNCNSFASNGCGVPQVPHHEPFGLYWVTLIPYFFLQFAGVGYYDIMRLMPVLFAVLEVIGVYFLARYWSRSRFLGLLAMLLVALNMGNAARTSALIYRGDSFVTLFAIVAIIATIAVFRAESRRRKVAYAVIAGALLSLCNLVWNGGPFVIAIYFFAIMLILILGFAFEKRKLVGDTGYVLLSLLVWFLLVYLYRSLMWIVSLQTFTGFNFFLLLVPTVLGWLFALYVMDKMHGKLPHIGTPVRKIALGVGIAVVIFLLVYILIPSSVNDIFVTSGFDITSAFASTIQEQQPPTYAFLFASFNFQNFTTPMNIIMVIDTFFSGLHIYWWIVLLALFAPYFFMQIDDPESGLLGGTARWRFEFNEATLFLVSYFALTAYLQMNAIRFNSLISIPMSIFSAYTIYWLIVFLKRYRFAYYASFVLVALLIIFVVQTDLGYITGLAPADQINPAFIQALMWMKNNTPSNSVVLTLWPDGSVVEGVAQRISVTDSVGSQYAFKADPFAAWLYNSSPDPGFLLANITGKPDYLLVRQAWMVETGGIFTESGINVSAGSYGYNPFTSLNERVNKTSQLYQFFGSGLEEDTVLTNTSTGQKVASYLKFSQGIQPFEYVDFYNILTGNWSIVKQTAFNVTNNQTFLISYSPIPAPNLYVNITSAYMLGPALADSNMVKFLFHCNAQACLWNNNVAGLRLVYINQDTKIFQILYNESNATVAAANFPR